MVLIAALRWARWWENGRVVCRIDIITAATAVNKGTSRCEGLMWVIRRLFWLSVLQNFQISCSYLPGEGNCLADALSRLHDAGKFCWVAKNFQWDSMYFAIFWPFWLVHHMSYRSFLFLVPQVVRWLNLGRSGGRRRWLYVH